jgi:hypothetical protein
MGKVTEFFRRLFRKKKDSVMEHDVPHRIACSTPQAMEHSVAQQNSVTVTEYDTGVVQATNPRGSQTEKLDVLKMDKPDLPAIGYGVRFQLPREKEDSRVISPARKAPLGNIRAVRKMKHGHQASWYRKSVKAKVKPEEEEEDS